jgi:hypothetical protein
MDTITLSIQPGQIQNSTRARKHFSPLAAISALAASASAGSTMTEKTLLRSFSNSFDDAYQHTGTKSAVNHWQLRDLKLH